MTNIDAIAKQTIPAKVASTFSSGFSARTTRAVVAATLAASAVPAPARTPAAAASGSGLRTSARKVPNTKVTNLGKARSGTASVVSLCKSKVS